MSEDGVVADIAGAGVAAGGTAAPDSSVVSDIAGSGGPAAEPVAADNSDNSGKFHLKLANFEGPFDLLLQLISSRRLDVTEIALHKVTDEFIAHTKALTARLSEVKGLRADKVLDQTTEFLLIAATLLDLKAARLLPSGEVSDEDDLELLEARDLLFARLLQYRAFKQVAELLGELEAAALQRYPRAVSLEERYLALLPEVTLGVDAAGFAEVAATVFRPRPRPRVGLDHIHAHAISIAEQAELVMAMLKSAGAGGWTTFHELCADCELPIQIVARFLALLELYRGKTIEFDQPDPLGPLSVSWIGELEDQPEQPVTIEEDYG
ncbi:segregation and condensation protein A [Nocardia tengchongensis]|uniref:segregation and condensation protein A n=1 Tax=Nocardia tengchongensis TaxID=2055889 RepID=UPI00367958B9